MAYVTQKTFEDMDRNMKELIGVLNHSVTELKIDVTWLKKLNNWQFGVMTGIFISVLGIAIKLIF